LIPSKITCVDYIGNPVKRTALPCAKIRIHLRFVIPSATIATTWSGMRVLDQTSATLRTLLANATAEDHDWQPSRERWSINMVLAHLADVEINGFVSRFRAVAREENPILSAYDQLALFSLGDEV